MTQRGIWFKSSNHNSSDDDEGSDKGSGEGSEADARSLPDSTYSSREIAENIEEPDASEAIEEPEDAPVQPAEEENWNSLKKKKEKKKSKVAAKRAIYEEV